MLLLTFAVTMTCAPEGVNPIWTGVAASDDSATGACVDGTGAWSVRTSEPTVLLPWLSTATQRPCAATLTGSELPDGAASTSQSVPLERIRKYETVLEAALTTSSARPPSASVTARSEEHTSELQSRRYIVCRLLLR